jgi:hypothetical protein
MNYHNYLYNRVLIHSFVINFLLIHFYYHFVDYSIFHYFVVSFNITTQVTVHHTTPHFIFTLQPCFVSLSSSSLILTLSRLHYIVYGIVYTLYGIIFTVYGIKFTVYGKRQFYFLNLSETIYHHFSISFILKIVFIQQ